jgi:hypothetical protein
MKIKLSLIDLTSPTQSRVNTCEETVQEYTGVLEDGGEFPPVDLFFNGEAAFIGDGWQRVYAHKRVGREEIQATMRQGGLREAVLFAASANSTHGLKRSNADKRKALQILLDDPEWSTWSETAIAAHCGVSRKLLSSMRNEQASQEEVEDAEAIEEEEDDEVFPFIEDEPVQEPEEDTLAELAAPYIAAIESLKSNKKILVDLAKEERNGIFLRDKITRIGKAVDDVVHLIKGVEPVEYCEPCEGAGCDECSKTGFLTRYQLKAKETAISVLAKK